MAASNPQMESGFSPCAERRQDLTKKKVAHRSAPLVSPTPRLLLADYSEGRLVGVGFDHYAVSL
jgi:hypothetical protein